jgi:hypothetical protein
MLAVAVRGALLGEKPGLVRAGFRNFFGIRRPPEIFGMAPADRKAADRQACLGIRGEPLLAWKARPLDGIRATAPYPHNGSAASLHELLLPANERLGEFRAGNHEHDPVKVGYSTDPPVDGAGFLLKARDAEGAPIDGNSNIGHEHGAAGLSKSERQALLGFLKQL